MDNLNQDELLEACQKGSESAFRQLFEQYHRQVLHLAFRFSGNIQEAEDIAQEVFLKVFKEIANFQGTSSFYTWLYRITVNVCLDKNRQRQRREKYHAKVNLEIHGHGVGEVALDQGSNALEKQVWHTELQQMLQAALNQIKPKLRVVIVLKHIQGLSLKEVAQILGCAEGTVSSRLNRGRMQLRRTLSRMGIDETYFQGA